MLEDRVSARGFGSVFELFKEAPLYGLIPKVIDYLLDLKYCKDHRRDLDERYVFGFGKGLKGAFDAQKIAALYVDKQCWPEIDVMLRALLDSKQERIPNYSIRKVYDCICKYDGRDNITNRFVHIIAYMDSYTAIDFANDILSDLVSKTFDKYHYQPQLPESIMNSFAASRKCGQKAVEIYNDMEDKMDAILHLMVQYSRESESDQLKLFKLLKHYENNHLAELCKNISRKNRDDLDELFKPEAYKLIEKNPVFIEKIIKSSYHNLRERVTDEVKERLTYNDLDEMQQTWTTISEIHKGKSSYYRKMILKSYCDELNRAVNQGINPKEKIQFFRQYVREVRQRVIKNASDLMVVTNGA